MIPRLRALRRLLTNPIAAVLAAAIAVAALVTALAAGGDADRHGNYNVNQRHYEIDGKTYRCFLVRSSNGSSSITCDWGHPLP